MSYLSLSFVLPLLLFLYFINLLEKTEFFRYFFYDPLSHGEVNGMAEHQSDTFVGTGKSKKIPRENPN